MGVEERSVRGPVVGAPLTWRELWFAAQWARARPLERNLLEGAMVVLQLRLEDLRDLAREMRPDLPYVAVSIEASLEEPRASEALTADEATLFSRWRRMERGRFTLEVADGVPTAVPERHWRWHAGGVRGYADAQVEELIEMGLREQPEAPAVDWSGLRGSLGQIAEGARAMLDGATGALQRIDGIEAEWGIVAQGREAMARLEVVRRALESPAAATALPPPVPAQWQTPRERVLEAARQVAGEGGLVARQDLIDRLSAGGPMPTATMYAAIGHLVSDGALDKVPGEKGVWRLRPAEPAE